MSYLSLKSGTDVRGTAVVTAAHPEFELTDKTVSDISAAFIQFLSKKTGKNVNEFRSVTIQEFLQCGLKTQLQKRSLKWVLMCFTAPIAQLLQCL